MMLELHLIQNIAPANLNRDDTGAPKDCIFGGVPRARISSQALKRAARMAFTVNGLTDTQVGVRTRLVTDEIRDLLINKHGRSSESAAQAAINALAVLDVNLAEEHTGYLLYLGRDAITRFADLVNDNFDALAQPERLKKGVVKQLKAADLFNVAGAVDLALFGRMVADLPDHNIDAASQVAHAISTHRVRSESDYFTAVDDLQPSEESGAGMIGSVEFNSACYYRYASVDTDQLVANLEGDIGLAKRGTAAYLYALTLSLPTGKQNSMAAHNPPSLVLATGRTRGQWNLANAFENPITSRNESLTGASTKRLVDYADRLADIYSMLTPQAGWMAAIDPELKPPSFARTEANLTAVVESAVEWAYPDKP